MRTLRNCVPASPTAAAVPPPLHRPEQPARRSVSIPELPAPTPEQSTLTLEQSTSIPELPAPTPEQSAPTLEQSTSIPELPAPTPQQSTPTLEQSTSIPELPAPTPEQSTPILEQSTPAHFESTPPQNESASIVEVMTLRFCTPAPVSGTPKPALQQAISASGRPDRGFKVSASTLEPSAPTLQQSAPTHFGTPPPQNESKSGLPERR